MSASYRRSAQLGLTAVACAVLAACGSFNSASNRLANIVTPYKIEIVQGNFVSKEQVDALKPGMSRNQVKDVLGTPLVTSLFHADRWDYVFTLKRQGVEPQARKLAVFFKNDVLERFEGDPMPTEAEFVATLDGRRKQAKVPLLEVPESVLQEFASKNPPVAAAVEPEPVAVAATYPPLEAAAATTQAWDASTQRAVTAAAARPQAPAPVLPAAVAPAPAPAVVAAAPVVVTPVAPQSPPVATAPVPAPAPARPAAAPAPVPAPAPAPVPAPAAAPVAPAAIVPVPVPMPAPARPAPAPAPAAVASAPAAPVATPAPAPAPAAVAGSFAGLDPEVTAFLNGWMNDWQARNATAFFARYVPEFKGTAATRAEWEALRRPRIESRLSISVGVQDVRGRMDSPTSARVVFRQLYESDAGSEIGTKAMFLAKRDGRWLIEREFFTPQQ